MPGELIRTPSILETEQKSFSLRLATYEDLKIITSIFIQGWLQNLNRTESGYTNKQILLNSGGLANIKNRFTTEFIQNKTFTVSTVSNKAAGYSLHFAKSEEVVFINHLYIHPKYRGCGHGSALLQRIIDANIEQNNIEIEVLKDNAVALSLYQKFGFKIIGQYDRIYEDKQSKKVLFVKPANIMRLTKNSN